MTYAVVFQNTNSGKVGMDKFTEVSAGAAKRDFFDCYRHANYRVLAVVEIPEVRKERTA